MPKQMLEVGVASKLSGLATFLRKTACLGGFSSFFVLVFVFKAIAVQRWFQGKKSDWSMSKDSR